MGAPFIARKRGYPTILGALQDPYCRLRDAVENAHRTIGCSANVVHLVSEKGFLSALRRLERFHKVSLVAMATTEFRTSREGLWTETFVNIENEFTRTHPEPVIAHEFAHIRQHFHMGGMLELSFRGTCPREARKMASIFLMGLEEVLADCLLPWKWRKEKNLAILNLMEKFHEAPHPIFLSVLRATMEPRKGGETFRRLMRRMLEDPLNDFVYKTALKYFRSFCVMRKMDILDLEIVKEGIDEIMERLFGSSDSCEVRLRKF
ncbi:hypothetical protein KEJ36_01605 [Candidatus Bathyarchaeota archaeon]|nr:hypothetical protein [Candidatus Bathyarchaeota archaeon]MBS7627511.1 hypothetical protein [Candidatus Bathyarchaeota archaeon]